MRRQIASGSPYEKKYGFSRAVVLGKGEPGDRVIVAGTAPVWPDGSVDPSAGVQTRRCLDIILDALAEAGGSAESVVRTRMFITDASYADEVGSAHGEVFADVRPGATMVVVAGLLDPRWKVEIEAEAVL